MKIPAIDLRHGWRSGSGGVVGKVGAGLLVLALGLGIVGLVWFTVSSVERAQSPSTTGVVVDHLPVQGDSGTTYKIRIEYDVNGYRYSYTTPYSMSPAPRIGEHKTIYYRGDNPGDASLGGILGWLGPLIVLSVAAFLALMGGIFVVAARRDARNQGAVPPNDDSPHGDPRGQT